VLADVEKQEFRTQRVDPKLCVVVVVDAKLGGIIWDD